MNLSWVSNDCVATPPPLLPVELDVGSLLLSFLSLRLCGKNIRLLHRHDGDVVFVGGADQILAIDHQRLAGFYGQGCDL